MTARRGPGCGERAPDIWNKPEGRSPDPRGDLYAICSEVGRRCARPARLPPSSSLQWALQARERTRRWSTVVLAWTTNVNRVDSRSDSWAVRLTRGAFRLQSWLELGTASTG